MSWYRVLTSLLLAVSMVGLAGCGEEEAKFEKKKVEVMTFDTEEEDFVQVTADDVFDAKMKGLSVESSRDLFKEMELVSGPAGANSGTLLETYELAQMQIVGIVWNIARPVALVRSPDGVEHNITLNTKIGKRGGKVVAILADRVIIEERFYNWRGELTTEQFVLSLPGAGEGAQ